MVRFSGGKSDDSVRFPESISQDKYRTRSVYKTAVDFKYTKYVTRKDLPSLFSRNALNITSQLKFANLFKDESGFADMVNKADGGRVKRWRPEMHQMNLPKSWAVCKNCGVTLLLNGGLLLFVKNKQPMWNMSSWTKKLTPIFKASQKLIKKYFGIKVVFLILFGLHRKTCEHAECMLQILSS